MRGEGIEPSQALSHRISPPIFQRTLSVASRFWNLNPARLATPAPPHNLPRKPQFKKLTLYPQQANPY